MKKVIHKANERGKGNYGWLNANYSFSFSNYYHPEKVNFGALRVLNDDFIAGGMGFGTHPHDNMEIITIPLQGSLKHRDSMSNKWIVLETGEVQVMSAGSGLQHAEMNNLPDKELNLFQLWIFPDQENVQPRYDQKKFDEKERIDKLQLLVSSINDTTSNVLKIHQNAKISRITLHNLNEFRYQLMSKNNGVYSMVVDGEVLVEDELLTKRDAVGIYDTNEIVLKSEGISDILFIEVPMQF